jgi:hypothetical protein
MLKIEKWGTASSGNGRKWGTCRLSWRRILTVALLREVMYIHAKSLFQLGKI